MPEKYHLSSLELSQNDEREILENLATTLLHEQSLENGIQILYRVLSAYIPFTQMLHVSLNKQNSMLTPWVVMEDGHIVPTAQALHITTSVWSDKDHIFIENDTASSSLAYQKDIYLSGKRSILSIQLYEDESMQASLCLQSVKPNQFQKKHAAIMAMLIKPLTALMASFFMHTSQFIPLQRAGVLLSAWELLCQCRGLRQMTRQIEAVAPTGSTTLILGETGVGKELVADSIHHLSKYSKGPLVKVNCASLPDSLIDSELFGHEKGAFTNAHSLHQGYFEQAHNGTLFLDEVGELALSAQARLLRVLETRVLQRVGGQRQVPVNVRLIAATNRNIPAMVTAGSFRQDLWFRLQSFPVFVPPLRQRREDIPKLIQYAYNTKISELEIKNAPKLPQKLLDEAMAYHWPGNVRQLMLWVERTLILALCHGKVEAVFEPSPTLAFWDTSPSPSSHQSLEEYTIMHIRQALEQCRGRIQGPGGAAELLNLPPNTLRSRMKKMGISKNDWMNE